ADQGGADRDFGKKNQQSNEILSEQDIAKFYRRSEVGLNAAALKSERIVGGSHQHEDQIGHHSGEEEIGRKAMFKSAGMDGRKKKTEIEDHDWRNEQRKKEEAASSQVINFFAENRPHLGGKKC